MTRDLFDKIYKDKGPLGKWASLAEGYFVFPKLEGQISNRMKFQGKDVITWSINDYLGLANHPEVRKVDAEAANDFGSAYPMGARMMSGHTSLHEQLQNELSEFVNKEAAYLLNFGYQGIMSTIDALVAKDDIIVYDVDAHACIIDGVRLHIGKRFTFKHNDVFVKAPYNKKMAFAFNVFDADERLEAIEEKLGEEIDFDYYKTSGIIEENYKGKIESNIRIDSMELDIYLPELNIGFEYNG